MIPEEPGRPFIRLGHTVFAPEELHINRFGELAGVTDALRNAGIEMVDELAVIRPDDLAGRLGVDAQRGGLHSLGI